MPTCECKTSHPRLSGKTCCKCLTASEPVEPSGNPGEGFIKIDGEQIDNIGLHVLRKGLCVIPQESFVFSGTLRFNVDPYNDFDDAAVYDVLEKYRIFESLRTSDDKVGAQSGLTSEQHF